MKKVQLNIGMENNPSGFNEVLLNVIGFGFLFSYREAIGEYDGNEEKTFVAVIRTRKHESQILEFVIFLTEKFTQECIAVKIDGKGYLVYNPSFEGDRMEFDDKYFIS